LAGVLGALAIDPGVPWVVVDAGTALTVNAVTPVGKRGKGRIAGVFEGGLIVPGEGLSLRALGEAAQLPSLKPRAGARKVSCWGRSTEEAIRFGVCRAQVASVIELVRAQAKTLGPKTRVALTGGGSKPLWSGVRNALKSYRPIRDPDLVHRGLLAALDFGRGGTD
jgi:pantothenate kinase type III